MNKINYTFAEIIDENSKKSPVMLIAFSIIAGFLFFLIILFYIRRYINKNKISSDYYMKEINKELRENYNLY